MGIQFRRIDKSEHAFLKEMLYEALFVPPGKPKFPKEILHNPQIKKYIENWGQQTGDVAIVAVNHNVLVGAIWGRKHPLKNKGYGFIDEETPERSMAVKKVHRNKGIGTELIKRIETAYSEIGIKNVSLSVDKLNPAKLLYERNGYVFVEENGTAITMRKKVKKE